MSGRLACLPHHSSALEPSMCLELRLCTLSDGDQSLRIERQAWISLAILTCATLETTVVKPSCGKSAVSVAC